jgi:predicted DNA-binding transcriptional regulator AlpA
MTSLNSVALLFRDVNATTVFLGRIAGMGRMVDLDDLIDAAGVADILGLSRATAVTVYLSRYPSLPRPCFTLGEGRVRLWLRSEVEAWQAQRELQRPGRKRPEEAPRAH